MKSILRSAFVVIFLSSCVVTTNSPPLETVKNIERPPVTSVVIEPTEQKHVPLKKSPTLNTSPKANDPAATKDQPEVIAIPDSKPPLKTVTVVNEIFQLNYSIAELDMLCRKQLEEQAGADYDNEKVSISYGRNRLLLQSRCQASINIPE